MNYKKMRYILTYPFSARSRKKLKRILQEEKLQNVKLIMTFVIKDEEDIIEKNIRFHKAMGVDGFIVTSHNSIDKTNEILEKLKDEGLVLEIIKQTSSMHQHHVWVTEMINLATKKYKADWIINADADEFYYSNSLNLKASIVKVPNANVLWTDSKMLFPDDRDDYLTCPYFLVRSFKSFEAEYLGIANGSGIPIGDAPLCRKVIHRTKGFVRILMGNHAVRMANQIEVESADIRLYHYHIKNYKGYEAKILRWLEAAKLMPDGHGGHVKAMIKLYEEGKLQSDYNEKYSSEMKSFLMEHGVVIIDPSVINFMKYHKIL